MKIKSIVITFDDSDEPRSHVAPPEHAKEMRFENGRWHFDGPVQARYNKLAADLWDRLKTTMKAEE